MISSAVGNLYLFKIFLILVINEVSKYVPISSSHSKIFLSIEFSSREIVMKRVSMFLSMIVSIGSVPSSMYTATS